MRWAAAYPGDWQLGGSSTAFLWGTGRNGQMAESGRVSIARFCHDCVKQRGRVYRVQSFPWR